MRHLARERFRKPLPTHVTLRLCSDVPSLRTAPIVHAIERTFAAGCIRPGFGWCTTRSKGTTRT
jgi:hypothetical protein